MAPPAVSNLLMSPGWNAEPEQVITELGQRDLLPDLSRWRVRRESRLTRRTG